MNYDFTAGDTGAKLKIAMIDKATGRRIVPFDTIYNAAVWVKPQGLPAVKRNMTNLTSANDGYAEYLLLGAELVEGTLQTQVEITKVSDGSIVSELQVTEWSVGPKLV
jgi:hypothetical protein